MSDRVVILERGRLVAQGSIEELLAIDSNRFSLTVRGDGASVLARLSSVPWVKNIEVDRDTPDLKDAHTTKLEIHVTDTHIAEAELLRLVLSDSGTVITQFNRSFHNLEDLFISLVENRNQQALSR